MIELSSEARKAYEEMLERVELMEQTEEEEVEEVNPGRQGLRPGAPPPPPAGVEEVVEEPEYSKPTSDPLQTPSPAVPDPRSSSVPGQIACDTGGVM